MEKLFKPADQIIHYSQLNNTHEPYAACFPTSLAMALRNNGYQYNDPAKGFDDYIFELASTAKYDKIWKSLDGKAKPHQLPGLMVVLANDLLASQGIKKTAKRVDYTYDTAKAQIDAGNQIVCGTFFTKFGHMICISGYTENTLIVNDPYGNVNEYYHFNDGNRLDDGALVKLDKQWLSKLWYLIVF